MNLIPNPFLMCLVFVVLIVLILLLNSWLYRPLLELMEKRKMMLSVDSETLEKEREEIQEIHQEIDRVISQAKLEAKHIKNQATLEAQKRYDESFERVRGEIEMKFLESKRLVDMQKDAIQKEMQKSHVLICQEIQEKIAKAGK